VIAGKSENFGTKEIEKIDINDIKNNKTISQKVDVKAALKAAKQTLITRGINLLPNSKIIQGIYKKNVVHAFFIRNRPSYT
jgi:hypothetical protein